MTDAKKNSPEAQEQRQADLAPETHNDEQDDHRSQAQQIAEDARGQTRQVDVATESTRGPGDNDLMNDSTQDIVEHMKDMESSGRIDMDAYKGEPNMDDNEDKYGRADKLDRDLTSDGSDVPGH